MKKIIFVFITLCFGTLMLLFITHRPVQALEKIEVTTVDPTATGYGTFNSHNQKIVSNQNGIFMTHLHSSNQNYDQNIWYLSRSTDGGKTFNKIYESTNGTSAPAIETDDNGNIYLAHPDWGIGYTQTYALFYKFTPNNNYTNPVITQIPNSAGGKYSMFFDKSRSLFYFFSHNNTFTVIDMNGQVKNSYQLTAPGSSAYIMYPYLYLDSKNDLYAAWTTQKFGVYIYWDIHFIVSKDGGHTWQKPDGTPLSLPTISDETGPTDRITLDDEFNVHTWLWGFLVKNYKVHFTYQTQSSPTREHYVQFDLQTNRINRNIYPKWLGESQEILGSDGFCATKNDNINIYCTGANYGPGGNGYQIVTLRSGDNGFTWHDYAVSDVIYKSIYSIGGSRTITGDGYIIGSYTEDGKEVKFFRIKIVRVQNPSLFADVSKTGLTLNIAYQNPSALSEDWIGLYHQGEADEKKYLDWKWLNNTKGAVPQSVNRSGTIILTVPDNNSYEVRYYTRDYSLSFAWKLLETKSLTGITIPGDLDQNGKIDIYDYSIMAQNFNKSQINCATGWNIADIVPNCRVDIFDFGLLVQNFGK